MLQSEVMKILETALDIGKQAIPEGEIATYIPGLAKADKNKLGVCLHTIDGREYSIGDCEDRFTIQSIMKVIALIIALETYSVEEVFKRVGLKPSGEAYNSLVELDYDNDLPYNPMINSGAIVISSMLVTRYSFYDMLSYAKSFCMDDDITLDEEVFKSEMDTCSRNRAIAYLLESKGLIDTDVEDTLRFYTKMCSMRVTAKSLANFGLVLANNGVNPYTNKKLINGRVCRIVKSIMLTCGMYDGSGEFAAHIGIPTKSGVGGGLLSVADKKMGIGVFGPSLDENGNCIAGVKLLQYISRKLELHIFHDAEWVDETN